jgi:hypothetical protein
MKVRLAAQAIDYTVAESLNNLYREYFTAIISL